MDNSSLSLFWISQSITSTSKYYISTKQQTSTENILASTKDTQTSTVLYTYHSKFALYILLFSII